MTGSAASLSIWRECALGDPAFVSVAAMAEPRDNGLPSAGARRGDDHFASLSGCYLLIVVGEPATVEHRDVILQKISKGFLSWDMEATGCCISAELQYLVDQDPIPEEAKNGEKLIQFVSENLVTEVLINPQANTLQQCMKNLLSSYTKHKHVIHSGYAFAGSGSWILQDSTYSFSDFLDAFQDAEVQRIFKAYENCISIHVHCAPEGDWTTGRLNKEPLAKLVKVVINPDDKCFKLNGVTNFVNFVGRYVVAQPLEELLEPSDVVGNIRFSRPTLYVFPGGQGDSALFGVNGFNMLIDGGFNRKACFWDFARHLDRVDALLVTRVSHSNVNGVGSFLKRKVMGQVYPKIGHVFCNIVDRKHSPDGDKDADSLLVSLAEEGHLMMENLRHLGLKPQNCYRESTVEPINLYHKVGHGKLDMFVLNPAKDSREVKEFLQQWHLQSSTLGSSRVGTKIGDKELLFPLPNLMSICAILVWQPADPNDSITRILFPGSSPQSKIFEGLDKLRHLEILKSPVCSEKTLQQSSSVTKMKTKLQIGDVKPIRLSAAKLSAAKAEDKAEHAVKPHPKPERRHEPPKPVQKAEEKKPPSEPRPTPPKTEEKKTEAKVTATPKAEPSKKAEARKATPVAEKKPEPKKMQVVGGKVIEMPAKHVNGTAKVTPSAKHSPADGLKSAARGKVLKEANNKKTVEEKNIAMRASATAKKDVVKRKAAKKSVSPAVVAKAATAPKAPPETASPTPSSDQENKAIEARVCAESADTREAERKMSNGLPAAVDQPSPIEDNAELDSHLAQDSAEEEKTSVDEKQSLDEEVQAEKDSLKRIEDHAAFPKEVTRLDEHENDKEPVTVAKEERSAEDTEVDHVAVKVEPGLEDERPVDHDRAPEPDTAAAEPMTLPEKDEKVPEALPIEPQPPTAVPATVVNGELEVISDLKPVEEPEKLPKAEEKVAISEREPEPEVEVAVKELPSVPSSQLPDEIKPAAVDLGLEVDEMDHAETEVTIRPAEVAHEEKLLKVEKPLESVPEPEGFKVNGQATDDEKLERQQTTAFEEPGHDLETKVTKIEDLSPISKSPEVRDHITTEDHFDLKADSDLSDQETKSPAEKQQIERVKVGILLTAASIELQPEELAEAEKSDQKDDQQQPEEVPGRIHDAELDIKDQISDSRLAKKEEIATESEPPLSKEVGLDFDKSAESELESVSEVAELGRKTVPESDKPEVALDLKKDESELMPTETKKIEPPESPIPAESVKPEPETAAPEVTKAQPELVLPESALPESHKTLPEPHPVPAEVEKAELELAPTSKGSELISIPPESKESPLPESKSPEPEALPAEPPMPELKKSELESALTESKVPELEQALPGSKIIEPESALPESKPLEPESTLFEYKKVELETALPESKSPEPIVRESKSPEPESTLIESKKVEPDSALPKSEKVDAESALTESKSPEPELALPESKTLELESALFESKTPELELVLPESKKGESESVLLESKKVEAESKIPEPELTMTESEKVEVESTLIELKKVETESALPESKSPEPEPALPESRKVEPEPAVPEPKSPEPESVLPESKKIEPESALPESKKAEPESALPESKKVEPESTLLESKKIEPELAVPESRSLEPESALLESKKIEPEPSILESKKIEPEPSILESKKIEPEPSILESKKIEPEPPILESKKIEPEPPILESKKIEPEPSILESKKVEPESALPESKKIEPEPAIPESKKIEPEPAIPESKKIEPEPAIPESKKIEPEPAIPESKKIEPEPAIPESKKIEPEPSILESKKIESEPAVPESKSPELESAIPESKKVELKSALLESKKIEPEPAIPESKKVELESALLESKKIEPELAIPESKKVELESALLESKKIEPEPAIPESKKVELESALLESKKIEPEPAIPESKKVEPESALLASKKIEPEPAIPESKKVEPESALLESKMVEPESALIESKKIEPERAIPESKKVEPESALIESKKIEPERAIPESKKVEPESALLESKKIEPEPAIPESKEVETESALLESEKIEPEPAVPESKSPELESAIPESKKVEPESTLRESKTPEPESAVPESKKAKEESALPKSKTPDPESVESAFEKPESFDFKKAEVATVPPTSHKAEPEGLSADSAKVESSPALSDSIRTESDLVPSESAPVPHESKKGEPEMLATDSVTSKLEVESFKPAKVELDSAVLESDLVPEEIKATKIKDSLEKSSKTEPSAFETGRIHAESLCADSQELEPEIVPTEARKTESRVVSELDKPLESAKDETVRSKDQEVDVGPRKEELEKAAETAAKAEAKPTEEPKKSIGPKKDDLAEMLQSKLLEEEARQQQRDEAVKSDREVASELLKDSLSDFLADLKETAGKVAEEKLREADDRHLDHGRPTGAAVETSPKLVPDKEFKAGVILSPIPEDAPKLAKSHEVAATDRHASMAEQQESHFQQPQEFLRTPDEVADLPIHEEVPTEFEGYYHIRGPLHGIPEALAERDDLQSLQPTPTSEKDQRTPDEPEAKVDEEPVFVGTLNADHAEIVTLSNGTSPSTPLSPKSPKDKEAKSAEAVFAQPPAEGDGLRSKEVDILKDIQELGRDQKVEPTVLIGGQAPKTAVLEQESKTVTLEKDWSKDNQKSEVAVPPEAPLDLPDRNGQGRGESLQSTAAKATGHWPGDERILPFGFHDVVEPDAESLDGDRFGSPMPAAGHPEARRAGDFDSVSPIPADQDDGRPSPMDGLLFSKPIDPMTQSFYDETTATHDQDEDEEQDSDRGDDIYAYESDSSFGMGHVVRDPKLDQTVTCVPEKELDRFHLLDAKAVDDFASTHTQHDDRHQESPPIKSGPPDVIGMEKSKFVDAKTGKGDPDVAVTAPVVTTGPSPVAPVCDKEYEGYYEVHDPDDYDLAHGGLLDKRNGQAAPSSSTKSDLDIVSDVQRSLIGQSGIRSADDPSTALSHKESISKDEKDEEVIDEGVYHRDVPVAGRVEEDVPGRKRSETFVGEQSSTVTEAWEPKTLKSVSALEQSFHADYPGVTYFTGQAASDDDEMIVRDGHEQPKTLPDVTQSPMHSGSYVSADDDTEDDFRAHDDKQSDADSESPYHRPGHTSLPAHVLHERIGYQHPQGTDSTSDDSDMDVAHRPYGRSEHYYDPSDHQQRRAGETGRGGQGEKWEFESHYESASSEPCKGTSPTTTAPQEFREGDRPATESDPWDPTHTYGPRDTPEYGNYPTYRREHHSSTDSNADTSPEPSPKGFEMDSPEVRHTPFQFAKPRFETKHYREQGTPEFPPSGGASLSSPGSGEDRSTQEDGRKGQIPSSKRPFDDWGEPMGLPSPPPPPSSNDAERSKIKQSADRKSRKSMEPKKQQLVSPVKNNAAKVNGKMDDKEGKKDGENKKDPPKGSEKAARKVPSVTGSPKRAVPSAITKSSPAKTKRPDSPLSIGDGHHVKSSSATAASMATNKAPASPVYVDLTYIPHHGNPFYCDADFFRTVRARYYVFSGTNPSKEVFNALLEAKQSWENPDLEVTIIPTYDTDTLGYWFALNEDELTKHKIDLAPSASRCTINLQDHETSCSAYRLEF